MAVQKASQRRRSPGSLRLVTKHAKGRPYRRWQWRTHRRSDLGWRTVDVELGEHLAGMRTRVLIALGELSAPLLVERFARWHFTDWEPLPAWTGRPDSARAVQRAAWWVEVPRPPVDRVQLRFRSLAADGEDRLDFRRCRQSIASVEESLSTLWRHLSADPIAELARLLWLQQQAQEVVDEITQRQIDLRRRKRQGEISQRDYEADERLLYCSLDEWEAVMSDLGRRYDDLLAEMVAAMPRPRREADRSRILAAADRLLNDPKRRSSWHAGHWDGSTLTW